MRCTRELVGSNFSVCWLVHKVSSTIAEPVNRQSGVVQGTEGRYARYVKSMKNTVKTLVETPFVRSYWLAGKILCGSYPGGVDLRETKSKLGRCLDRGISIFIDLTERRERTSFGERLVPYDTALNLLARERSLNGDPCSVAYHRFEIPDNTAPTFEQMDAIMEILTSASIHPARGVYLHCRGGIGRTGCVAATYLVASGATTTARVFDLFDSIRKGSGIAHQVSPEFGVQRRFVVEYAQRLRKKATSKSS